MTRCQSCHKPVSPRRQTCNWCKEPTGLPRHPAFPEIDQRLEAIRLFGVPMALWGGFVAWLAAVGHHGLALPVAAFALAAAMLVAHLLLPMSRTAWDVAEWGWLVVALAGVDLVVQTHDLYPVAIVPVLAWGAMRYYRRTALGRLEGKPPEGWVPRTSLPEPGPCGVCGAAEAKVVAPRYCLSYGVATSRFSGAYRNLCRKHAVRRAIPATLISALGGWWGVPWGVVWTPQVLRDNVRQGGVAFTPGAAEAIRRVEQRAGGLRDHPGGLALVLGLLLCPAMMLVPAIPYLEQLAAR